MAAAAGQCERLHRRLSSLLHLLGSTSLDMAAADEMRNACDALTKEVEGLPSLEGSPQDLAALRRTLERAPERIQACTSDMHGDGFYFWRTLSSHRLATACLLLGTLSGLPPASRARLAAFSFQHVRTHSSGLVELIGWTARVMAQLPDSAATAAMIMLTQLSTVEHIMQELPEQMGTDALSLMPPQQLVAWLKECTPVLLSLPPQVDDAKHAASVLAILAFKLCCVPSWAVLGQAIGEDEQLPGRLVALLQPLIAGTAAALQLPDERRGGAGTWLSAGLAVAALVSQPVQPALERRLDRDASKAPAQLLAAAQLLEQLPLEPMPTMSQGPHMMLARSLPVYCGLLARRLVMAGAAQQQQQQQQGQQRQQQQGEQQQQQWQQQQQAALQRQLVRQLLACTAKLPSHLRFRAGQPPSECNWREVAQHCFSLLAPAQLLVQLFACDSPADGSQAPGGSPPLALPPTEQDAVAWCTSAAAALAAVPLLVQAQQQVQSSGADDWTQLAVARMLRHLATMQCIAAQVSLRLIVTLSPQGSKLAHPATMQQALFQLHTTGCRLVAWCNANRQGDQLPLDMGDMHLHLAAMADALLAAMQLQLNEESEGARSPPAASPPSTCDLQAMALAHWSAVRTLVPSLAGGSGVPPGQLHNLSMSLAACIARGPTLLGLNPELHQLFNEMLSRVPQEAMLPVARSILVAAWRGPPLAVYLLLSGRLERMLDTVLELDSTGLMDDKVPELLKGVYNIAHGLHSAADSALASQGVAADEPPADSPLAALKAAQTQLSTALQLGAVEVEEAAALLQDLVLPLCHELAVALQAWWQLHEQQAELQLAAAQAAARRSCAYLGCANLGGEGGPAAGEGVGSMRCSACRAVWYCGTACSHADWRAGHRRVCKALAAARAAEKERRRQQLQES